MTLMPFVTKIIPPLCVVAAAEFIVEGNREGAIIFLVPCLIHVSLYLHRENRCCEMIDCLYGL